jgi:hypothetical protein
MNRNKTCPVNILNHTRLCVVLKSLSETIRRQKYHSCFPFLYVDVFGIKYGNNLLDLTCIVDRGEQSWCHAGVRADY